MSLRALASILMANSRARTRTHTHAHKGKATWVFATRCLSYFHRSADLTCWLAAAECTVMNWFCCRGFLAAQNDSSCLLTVRPQSTYLFWRSSDSQSRLQSEHFFVLFFFFAHCVYTANYAWRLCTPSARCWFSSDESVPRVCCRGATGACVRITASSVTRTAASRPTLRSHLRVTSDERSRCSPLETLHGSLAR